MPTTQQVLDALEEMHKIGLAPGWINVLKSTRAKIERLKEIEEAARTYYMNYCQDEADEEGICGLKQQREAQALRDALRD